MCIYIYIYTHTYTLHVHTIHLCIYIYILAILILDNANNACYIMCITLVLLHGQSADIKGSERGLTRASVE